MLNNFIKVGSDPFFKVFSLSNINDVLLFIKILIDPWDFGQAFYLNFDGI